MTIELTILISSISVAFAVYAGINNLKRNYRTDLKQNTSEMTTVIVKLENIGADVVEIKADLGAIKNDVREVRERVIRTEESTKQAHKRIDALEHRLQQISTEHE